MKNIILLLLLVSAGWYGYKQYQLRAQTPAVGATEAAASAVPELASEGRFKCDGRTYCSQMTSCAEATFFLKNCPYTKMDGNNDGVPCEKQWCK
ncbi:MULTISPECIES: excalibur calcium-binding domain-containing protein [Synechococcales]|uniref:excalibur calcium-binding domain-containing protein n=1 Tax=Synechococcus sp. CS-1324 TaxID=2847980 RepID=UPI0037D9B5FC